jgi:cobaltochelatase CobN
MHRIAAMPGGWNPEEEGVVFIEQDPAPIVILTAADTDISGLARAVDQLPAGFPAVRVASLLALQQPLTIDTYGEDVLESAKVIVIRLLGGVSYWAYGLEVVQEIVERFGTKVIVIPGDDRPDPALSSRSTVPLTDVDQVWRYFTEGGVGNFRNLLGFLADRYLGVDQIVELPQPIPRVGLYPFPVFKIEHPRVGIVFYRAHYLAGNTEPIDALCQTLIDLNLTPVPVFISSLRDPDVQLDLLSILKPGDEPAIEVLLNTTSFSLLNPAPLYPASPSVVKDTAELWDQLDVPILQVILSGGPEEQWRSDLRGLSPRDTAMNVALPEVDGRIITRTVSFKAVRQKHPILQTDVIGYQSVNDRILFVCQLAANWVKLRRASVADRKVSLILANYPNRDGRLANGVGLDTPQSCVEILRSLKASGYKVSDIPEDGDELIRWLTKGITNDPEGREIRSVFQTLERSDYETFFGTLPIGVREAMGLRWSIPLTPLGRGDRNGEVEKTNSQTNNHPTTFKVPLTKGDLGGSKPNFPIAGIQLGNIFIGIQPARGYDRDPSLNYHAPDLEPTHEYLAFYHWVRSVFGSHAVVHVGKHGNLEWLPGKSVALSENCYPEIALGPMPHLYPFIVNDPGEGAQAKRRSQAVILDHLTPPMTRAELYGDLQDLENLVDEYYEAMNLDPSRLKALREKIITLLEVSQLNADLGLQLTADELRQRFENTVMTGLDRSLCELKEAQIRDGLHILGQCPSGDQLRDLIIAIARYPQAGRMGLSRAIAEDLGFDFDPLMADPAEKLEGEFRTVGGAIERIEEVAIGLVSQLVRSPLAPLGKGGTEPQNKTESPINPNSNPNISNKLKVPLSKGDLGGSNLKQTTQELHWITTQLLPNLLKTTNEITNLLKGLNGQYIPAGPSGAPTRGRPEVLPTGRNFYSVDIRAVPTESAWDVGRKAAETLVERYTQENGEYPKTLGLSIWGTSTMRTGGDDLAQALALMGVKPVWDGASRRVVDFEILPIKTLGRPRVDVTLRISGFFRDAFPNLIELFDKAVALVSTLNESAEDNPIAASVIQEAQAWTETGLEPAAALARSRYRVFGSKPGAYGAGLQGLIESQNWESSYDLARAYLNWSSYAYTSNGPGESAPEAFEMRLKDMQVVLQNQDNREHDLLDSDDYYQFQGGMVAAIKTLSNQTPTTYFGDNSNTNNPKVRSLTEELSKVYRSRVINPKWISGVMRHGYKGAFELSATVDFLFGYSATTGAVPDHMYEGITNAYLLDEQVQAFLQKSNIWAARDIAERLLEAHQRKLWKTASPEMLDQIRAIVLSAEGAIEETLV